MKLRFLMAPEGATAATPAPPTATPAPAAPAAAPAPAATPAAPAAQPTLLTPAEPPKAADAPQGDGGRPQDATPADIKIKVPEGFDAAPGTKKMIEGFVSFAKENKIPEAAAQKFFDAYVEQQNADVREAQMRRAEMITTWAEETKNDPEIGGAKFDATIAAATKGLQQFGSPELSKLLAETGLGNHKAVIKAFAMVGAKVAEDKPPLATTRPTEMEPTEADRLKTMYDKSPEMFKRQ